MQSFKKDIGLSFFSFVTRQLPITKLSLPGIVRSIELQFMCFHIKSYWQLNELSFQVYTTALRQRANVKKHLFCKQNCNNEIDSIFVNIPNCETLNYKFLTYTVILPKNIRGYFDLQIVQHVYQSNLFSECHIFCACGDLLLCDKLLSKYPFVNKFQK